MTAKAVSVHLLSPREYEHAMFNDLYYRYRSPGYVVVPDLRTIRGQISGELRQIDVAVYERGIAVPALAVECKRQCRGSAASRLTPFGRGGRLAYSEKHSAAVEWQGVGQTGRARFSHASSHHYT